MYLHLYKSSTYKILSEGLPEPVWSWFWTGLTSISRCMIVAQVTGHFHWCVFKASTRELHSVTSRIVQCFLRKRPFSGIRVWMRFYAKKKKKDIFFKWLSRSSQAISPVEYELGRRSNASTPDGKLQWVTLNQSVTLQP